MSVKQWSRKLLIKEDVRDTEGGQLVFQCIGGAVEIVHHRLFLTNEVRFESILLGLELPGQFLLPPSQLAVGLATNSKDLLTCKNFAFVQETAARHDFGTLYAASSDAAQLSTVWTNIQQQIFYQAHLNVYKEYAVSTSTERNANVTTEARHPNQ